MERGEIPSVLHGVRLDAERRRLPSVWPSQPVCRLSVCPPCSMALNRFEKSSMMRSCNLRKPILRHCCSSMKSIDGTKLNRMRCFLMSNPVALCSSANHRESSFEVIPALRSRMQVVRLTSFGKRYSTLTTPRTCNSCDTGKGRRMHRRCTRSACSATGGCAPRAYGSRTLSSFCRPQHPIDTDTLQRLLDRQDIRHDRARKTTTM